MIVYSAESKEIEGEKIESTRRDVIYYMIRFEGGSFAKAAAFRGFGDPQVYGYTLGELLYTNIVQAYRIPDPSARWWAVEEVRISVPGAKIEDVRALTTSLVFNLSVFEVGGKGHLQILREVDLFNAPLLSLPSEEGIAFAGARSEYVRREASPLQLEPIPGGYSVKCELTAGKELLLSGTVNLYIVAHVIYFYVARDKRTEREPAKATSAAGVRLSVDVVDQINALVTAGEVKSKSEFIRNAVDLALQLRGGGS